MRFSRRPLGLLLLFLLALGCGKSIPKTVPVSGKVTMDNQPLAHAFVNFTPADGQNQNVLEAMGETDDQGHYSLKLIQSRTEGAAPGEYKVRISLMVREGGKGQVLPEEYNKKTTLSFKIPAEGTTEANFTLTKNPGGPRRGPRP
jgi:hypothetical protein